MGRLDIETGNPGCWGFGSILFLSNSGDSVPTREWRVESRGLQGLRSVAPLVFMATTATECEGNISRINTILLHGPAAERGLYR